MCFAVMNPFMLTVKFKTVLNVNMASMYHFVNKKVISDPDYCKHGYFPWGMVENFTKMLARVFTFG